MEQVCKSTLRYKPISVKSPLYPLEILGTIRAIRLSRTRVKPRSKEMRLIKGEVVIGVVASVKLQCLLVNRFACES
jgi:hypothetical protein